MKYEVNIKLSMSSTDNAEQVSKRLRAVLEFGTIREAIGDALDLPTDHQLIEVDVTPVSPTNR